MGMDISFVVISKDVQQLKSLKEYIRELYSREVNNEHRMLGYDMEIVTIDDFHILCGCHRKCFGYDLGFWCKADDKNSLLENTIYLEEREDEEEILQYLPEDVMDEYGLLGCTRIFMNPYKENVPSADVGLSEKVLQVVVCWFKYGRLP